MKLPVIIPEIKSQSWSCRACTKCCRELVVHLTASDRRRIDEQDWREKLGTDPYVRHSSGIVLNHVPDGGCVFLMDDGKCRIHAELGMQAKPLACQIYPFTLERESDSLRAGLRFDCPTVTRNEGAALASHRRDIQYVADTICRNTPALFREDHNEIAFSHDLTIDRSTLDRILARLDTWISNDRRSFDERITGLYVIVSTLNQAQLSRFDGARLAELIDMLTDDLPNAVAEFDDGSSEPLRTQTKLLHQAVFAHSMYLKFSESRMGYWQSLRFRFRQLKLARIMLNGRGVIPQLRPEDGRATFEQIINIDPIPTGDATEAANLLTRYLQSRISNRGGFAGAYYAWPMLNGLGAALLSIAVIGWFARRNAATAGRAELTIQDVRDAVSTVDRTAGRAPELGAKSARLRQDHLSHENGLIRLIRRYRIL